MKHILSTNNTKPILFLPLKHTLFCSLTIIILFSIANIFAAEERKEPEKKIYDDALTEELSVLNFDDPEWKNAETINKIYTLINDGANPNHFLFTRACLRDNIPLIKICMAKGAKINAIDLASGVTPLFYASSAEAIQLLLDAKADVNFKQIIGTDPRTHETIGAQALQSACRMKNYPLEAIEILCNATRPIPILSDQDGFTPLHYLCMTENGNENNENNDFFPKAMNLLWWSPEQKNILSKNYKNPAHYYLETRAPHLVEGFDAIAYDVERAQAELSPVLPMLFNPPMPLKEFNQIMDRFAKNKLRLLINEQLYSDEQLVVDGIANIIISYTDRFTPYPRYPAIAYQEGDDAEYVPNTRHVPKEYLLSIQNTPKKKKPNTKKCLIS